MGENQQQLEFKDVVAVLADSPTPRTLKDGSTFAVNKVKMRHLGFMVGFIERIVAELGVDAAGNVSIDLSSPDAILKLISKLPEELAEAVCMLTSISRDEYDDLDLADGTTVIKSVVEVNRSFFTEEVLPKFKEILVAAKGKESSAKATRKTS